MLTEKSSSGQIWVQNKSERMLNGALLTLAVLIVVWWSGDRKDADAILLFTGRNYEEGHPFCRVNLSSSCVLIGTEICALTV